MSSSDDDFWKEVEFKPVLRERKKPKIDEFFTIERTDAISIFAVKYEKVFSNMRLAKEVELATQKMMERNKTIKELQVQIQEIKNKYEADVAIIVKQNQVLKKECKSLRKNLKESGETCKTQEYLLTYFRVLDMENKKSDLEVKKTDKVDPPNLKSQVKLLKDVCNLYMTNIDELKIQMGLLEEEIKKIKQDHLSEISLLQNEKKETVAMFEKKIKGLQEKFEKYKDEVKSEMSLNGLIQKKLAETNSVLKDELKNAQMILATPRLRQKTFERFKSVSIEKSVSGINKSSLLSLPLISSEKEGFSTHFDTPKSSSKLIELNFR